MIDEVKSNNYIAFAKDDIVCFKQKGETPFGNIYTEFKDVVPMKVLEVIIDERASERVGKLGNSNVYRVQSLFDNRIQKCYQYQLDLWQSVKDEIIHKLEQHISFLKGI